MMLENGLPEHLTKFQSRPDTVSFWARNFVRPTDVGSDAERAGLPLAVALKLWGYPETIESYAELIAVSKNESVYKTKMVSAVKLFKAIAEHTHKPVFMLRVYNGDSAGMFHSWCASVFTPSPTRRIRVYDHTDNGRLSFLFRTVLLAA